MFDIGFWELLLIGVVALVVIGPERLPEVARSAGVYLAKFRRFVAGVKSDINAELETGELKKILGDQKEQIQELRSIVDSTRKDIESSTSDVISSAKNTLDSVQEDVRLASAGMHSKTDKPAVVASSDEGDAGKDSAGDTEPTRTSTDSSSAESGKDSSSSAGQS